MAMLQKARLVFLISALVAAVILIGAGLRYEQLQQRLATAVSEGDTQGVTSWLARGAEMNGRCYNTDTALWAPLVPVAYPNAWDTALHRSAQNPNPLMVAFLLAHGANPNATDGVGDTPLSRAISDLDFDGGLERQGYLLQNMRLLIAHGADVNKPGMFGTPLEEAVKMRSPQATTFLIASGADVNQRGPDGATPLVEAAEVAGEPEMARLLIAHGADPNETNRWGETPIERAILEQNNDVVNVLLQGEARLDLRMTPSLRDAVLQVVNMDQRATLHSLLMHGLNPNDTDPDSEEMTPLLAAVVRGDPGMVQDLLDHGANPNPPASVGDTPLVQAAGNENSKDVHLLLVHGADPGRAGYDGFTPLIASAGAGLWQEYVAENHMLDGEKLLKATMRKRPSSTAIAQMLISRGVNVHATDQFGNTALTYAVGEGDTNLVKLLVAHGAHAPRVDSEGETLVNCARRRGYSDIVRFLGQHPQVYK